MKINHHQALVEGLKLARKATKAFFYPGGHDLKDAMLILDNWAKSLPVEKRDGRPGRRADDE